MRSDGLYSKYRGFEVRVSVEPGTTLLTLISKDEEVLSIGFKKYEDNIFFIENIPRSELGECFHVANFAKCDGHESMFSGPDEKGLVWLDTRDVSFAEKYEHFLYDNGLWRVGVPMDKCTFREEIIPYTLPIE